MTEAGEEKEKGGGGGGGGVERASELLPSERACWVHWSTPETNLVGTIINFC